MGCDIHLFVEKKVNGKWVIQAPPTEGAYDHTELENSGLSYNDYCASKKAPYRFKDDMVDPSNSAYKRYAKSDDGFPFLRTWFDNRNYSLFAMLADVRNYNDIEPFSKARGIPEDASEDYRKSAETGRDWHHHTYFTLKEIEEYVARAETWTIRETGVIGAYDAREWILHGGIPSLSYWYKNNVTVVSTADFICIEPLIDYVDTTWDPFVGKLPVSKAPNWFKESYPHEDGSDLENYTILVDAVWIDSYKNRLVSFRKLLAEIKEVCQGNPEDLRICCYFDN